MKRPVPKELRETRAGKLLYKHSSKVSHTITGSGTFNISYSIASYGYSEVRLYVNGEHHTTQNTTSIDSSGYISYDRYIYSISLSGNTHIIELVIDGDVIINDFIAIKV